MTHKHIVYIHFSRKDIYRCPVDRHSRTPGCSVVAPTDRTVSAAWWMDFCSPDRSPGLGKMRQKYTLNPFYEMVVSIDFGYDLNVAKIWGVCTRMIIYFTGTAICLSLTLGRSAACWSSSRPSPPECTVCLFTQTVHGFSPASTIVLINSGTTIGVWAALWSCPWHCFP
jgi:hypothetical protein